MHMLARVSIEHKKVKITTLFLNQDQYLQEVTCKMAKKSMMFHLVEDYRNRVIMTPHHLYTDPDIPSRMHQRKIMMLYHYRALHHKMYMMLFPQQDQLVLQACQWIKTIRTPVFQTVIAPRLMKILLMFTTGYHLQYHPHISLKMIMTRYQKLTVLSVQILG